jgi:hypothetical protein
MAIPAWLTWALVLTTASAVSGVTAYLMGLRKWRLECQKLKLEIAEKESALQKQSFELAAETSAHILLICVDNAKKMQSTNNLIFNEEILRSFLGPNADTVHAAVNVLIAKGRAKNSGIPGHWVID